MIASFVGNVGGNLSGAQQIIIFGIFAPILLIIGYGLFGFITGYVMSWLYNLFAKHIGGIQIEVD